MSSHHRWNERQREYMKPESRSRLDAMFPSQAKEQKTLRFKLFTLWRRFAWWIDPDGGLR